MANIKYGDLSGHRFGMLEVIRPAEPHTFPSGHTSKRWICRCDCGNEITVLQNSLVSGHSKSCGCKPPTLGHRWAKDLTGQKIGDLEILERAGSSNRGSPLWRCLCHRCGKEVIMDGNRLISSKRQAKDCGCRYREKIADISGQEFGGVEVLRCTGIYPSGDKAYLCRCKICGNERTFPGSQIRSFPKSCGCIKQSSDHMKEISQKAVEANIVDGVNLSCVFKPEATKRSKTGVRGVFPESGRPGLYRASCCVHGEVWVRTGFTSIESAKEARDKAQAELIEKYNVKNPKGEKNA